MAGMAISVNASFGGDWDGLLNFLSAGSLKRLTRRLQREITKKLAEEYVKNVRDAIYAGNVEGPPLSATTIAAKGHGSPWLDTEDLVNSLTTWDVQNGKMRAGIPQSAVNRRGQSLDLIALILEIGSYKVAARPVFEPQAQTLAALHPGQIGIERIVRDAVESVT